MESNDIEVERHVPAEAGDDVIAEFHGLWAGWSVETRPLDPPPPLVVLAAAAKNFPEFMHTAVFLAREPGGQAVGFAMLTERKTGAVVRTPQMQLWAKPEHRRQGAAVRLLEALCEEARTRGLTKLTTNTTEGVGWGEELCLSVGSQAVSALRTWRLPVAGIDRDTLRSTAALAAERARGYELLDVTSPLPDEIAGDAVDLLQFLEAGSEAEAAGQPRRLTVEALRQLERTWEAMGSQRHWQFARHDASGALAAVLEAVWSPAAPKVITIDNVVVRPEFRGRSLGLWMKSCGIDKALDAWPNAEEIRTTTTDPNPAMDSVDQRLGFQPYLRNTVWEADVEVLQKWLASDHG
jgi:GNAT superfamily N-acetyltransferase